MKKFFPLEISISLTLVTVFSFPTRALPTSSQINYIAQKVCESLKTADPGTSVIKDQVMLDKATNVYYQELGLLLDKGHLLPIEFVNDNTRKTLQYQVVTEVDTICQKKIRFIPFED